MLNLKKSNVPCVSSLILKDSMGVVDVIKQLNFSRLEVDKAPLLVASSTLYTKIDLMDLKTCMKVLINKESFGDGIYLKISCELNCTSNSLSSSFLDLVVRQVLKVYLVIFLTNIFNQSMQLLK